MRLKLTTLTNNIEEKNEKKSLIVFFFSKARNTIWPKDVGFVADEPKKQIELENESHLEKNLYQAINTIKTL